MPFDFAVPDWQDKLARGETPLPNLPLNTQRATKAVNIFDSLRLPDQTGFPLLRDAAGDWFRDLLRIMFAAEDPETGLPLVNEVLCLVPKKNSKTTYAAAAGVTALILWEQPNAELMILGPTQSIADRCFAQMQGMIKADPELAKIFHIQDHLKTITRIKTGAKLRVKTFDMNVVTGDIPALTIIDELHLLGSKNGAERVIKQITGGMITNHSALVVYITTQSDVPPQGVFKKKLDYARGVRDGRIADAANFLALLYEFPESVQVDPEEPWRDPALWGMVLPNLGRSIQLDLLMNLFVQAVEEGKESLQIWASQHLNIQIGMALHDDRWSGADHWAASVVPGMTLDDLLRRSEVCVIGVDWGGADDLASLTVMGREKGSKRWLQWSMSWARPTVLKQRKAIASALEGFIKDGDLELVETPDEQAERAAEVCAQVFERGLLPEEAGIGLDVAGVALLQDALEARGMIAPLVTGVPQDWKLQQAISTSALKLEAKKLRHAGQPIMAWAVSNAKQTLQGSNYRITKQASGACKIDPLMAMFDAAYLMLRNPVASSANAFEYTGM